MGNLVPARITTRPTEPSEKQKTGGMGIDRQRIQVIGSSSPLLEGVVDLLQLTGYQVDMSSSWVETEYALRATPPNLVIVDLSGAAADAYRLSEQIRRTPHWSDVPILFISFSGDDRIRDLQRQQRKRKTERVHFYAHTLLSMNGLLDKVQACLV
jgi:PleD family two-component response regulator